MSTKELYNKLRDKGVKCICSDCDAFGCGNCLICRINESEIDKLLQEIERLENNWGIKLISLNDPNNKGSRWAW